MIKNMNKYKYNYLKNIFINFYKLINNFKNKINE